MTDTHASPVLDFGRAVLPHKDPTFDAVWKRLQDGELLTGWQLVGPAGALTLMPEVTAELLTHLRSVADAKPSRSGATLTYRMKGRA